jgi:hypothetical protein
VGGVSSGGVSFLGAWRVGACLSWGRGAFGGVSFLGAWRVGGVASVTCLSGGVCFGSVSSRGG